MRSLMILVVLSLVALTGCLSATQQKMLTSGVVGIDHEGTWPNNLLRNVLPGRTGSSAWRTITVAVVNGTQHDVEANVSCSFRDSKIPFGETSKIVYSASHKSFLVRGLPQFFEQGVTCRLRYTYLVELK